jgi:2-(1,2-epoxy-1,2-dihydrophenyl)acetyl-CoA isomerase
VILPTRGRPELLTRALGSLVAQNDPAWEAIVVDDGEGDGAAAAETLGDRRVRTLRNPGRGVAESRITGIAAACGELVCWLDDDDWWDDPHHLSLLREAAANRSAFFYRSGWIVTETGGNEEGREPFDLDATCSSLRVNNTILTSSIAYPRALHDRLGPLDPACGGYCDWDFLVRMCDAGLEPHRLPGPGVCYSVRGGENLSARIDAPERLRSFNTFAAKHSLDIVIANHVTIHRVLADAPEGWQEVDGALRRMFEFTSYTDGAAFVQRVAALAEAEDHHPDVELGYRKVTLSWSTHSAGGITDRDRDLARKSAALADRVPRLLVDIADGVATVTLNRPDRLNALDSQTFDELEALTYELPKRDDVRAVVITGAGRAFCAGADLKSFAEEVRIDDPQDVRDYLRRVGRVVRRLVELDVPTLAAVNGLALGGGANLALCCDLVLMREDALFSEAYVKRGLVVDMGGSYFLPRLVGRARANEIALLGEDITAVDAVAMGIANRAVPVAEWDETIRDWGQRLANGAGTAQRMIKTQLLAAPHMDLQTTLELEADGIALVFQTHDLREALSAFSEKREPRFTGR